MILAGAVSCVGVANKEPNASMNVSQSKHLLFKFKFTFINKSSVAGDRYQKIIK
jgi:hypothetical protein